MSTEQITVSVVRYYLDSGVAKAEMVLWQWVRGAVGEDRPDPGLLAKARPLPAAYDPGLKPNQWVWIGANDAAAALPRPKEIVRGVSTDVEGNQVETAEHFHGEDSAYWDYYRLPLRTGVELVAEDVWRTAGDAAKAATAKVKADREAAAAEARAARDVLRASAAEKLAKLGLTVDEVAVLFKG